MISLISSIYWGIRYIYSKTDKKSACAKRTMVGRRKKHVPRTSVGLKRFCQARAGELISNIPGAFFLGGWGDIKEARILLFFGERWLQKQREVLYMDGDVTLSF